MTLRVHILPVVKNFGRSDDDMINALSFYVTQTVLVGPKWVWSDQIDLDLTIMILSRPK